MDLQEKKRKGVKDINQTNITHKDIFFKFR